MNKNFGPDSETPFNVEACDEAWQGPTEKDITCPFGGYIQVKIQGLVNKLVLNIFILKTSQQPRKIVYISMLQFLMAHEVVK